MAISQVAHGKKSLVKEIQMVSFYQLQLGVIFAATLALLSACSVTDNLRQQALSLGGERN